jgi:hypothetical protein
VRLHVLTSFWVFLKSVDLHVPTYFCEFFYAKGILKQKHVNAIYSFVFLCLLTVDCLIKVRLDLQADKSSIVVKGPFLP